VGSWGILDFLYPTAAAFLLVGAVAWTDLARRSLPGVPVKEYVAQSTEFVICFFVLLAIGFRFVHQRCWLALRFL